MAVEAVPGLGSYQWGDTIDLSPATVADVVAWAIKTGRIPAIEETLWTARLLGDGREAYAAELVGQTASRVQTFGAGSSPSTSTVGAGSSLSPASADELLVLLDALTARVAALENTGAWDDVAVGEYVYITGNGFAACNPVIGLLPNRPIMTRFRARSSATFDEAAFTITNAGAVGDVMRLGLYADLAGVPTGVPIDLGTVTDATGAFTTRHVALPAPVSLVKDAYYWTAFQYEGATGTFNIYGSNADNDAPVTPTQAQQFGTAFAVSPSSLRPSVASGAGALPDMTTPPALLAGYISPSIVLRRSA